MRTDHLEPMSDEEFKQVMDGLIEKGIVTVGRNKQGELGFVVTALGMAAFREAEQIQ